ncbi:hypothetical protein TorRG33x02_289290 [Trema orientale]|uniref:Uncharacterized protein n=1 Tax=Trema orientale TaxID=63057 RepID=A0A2P5CDD2_TREOI|nr:hypothetical protein TorRG33x02_289290 [Trema orientale]
MTSVLSGQTNSGSKGFDFASDDVICSYEDYGKHNSSNGGHSDPVISSSLGNGLCAASNPSRESGWALSNAGAVVEDDAVLSIAALHFQSEKFICGFQATSNPFCI